MTNEQCLNTIKNIRKDQLRYIELAKSKKRRMRPSERAMAIASLQMDVEALDWAISHLEPLAKEQP